MKKKLFSCILLAVFACVALFGLAACDNGSGYDDSALVDRIEALEDQIAQQGETIKNQQDTIDEQSQTIENHAAAITALQTSVTELQTAKTTLEKQIASLEDDNTANKTEITTLKTKVEALEAANANFQQQLAALDTSSDTFADDLAELTSNYNSLTASVQNATHIERVVVTEDDIGENKYITRYSFSTAVIDNKLSVGCAIYYTPSLFKYQLATCKVTVSVNSEIYDVGIYMTRTDAITETPSIRTTYQTEISVNNAEDIEETVLKEIILYRFD